MTTTTVTSFRRDIYTTMENTVRYNEPVRITAKEGSAILLSEPDYLGLMETVHLTSIPGMREKLIEGLYTPLEETIPEEEVEW